MKANPRASVAQGGSSSTATESLRKTGSQPAVSAQRSYSSQGGYPTGGDLRLSPQLYTYGGGARSNALPENNWRNSRARSIRRGRAAA